MPRPVPVPRGKLEALLADVAAIRKELDKLTRLRVDVIQIERRLRALVDGDGDDDKTPVRSPSTDAMEAFETSSRFLAPRKPRGQ